MESIIPMSITRKGMIETTNIYSGAYELIDSNSVLYFDSNAPLEIEEVFNSSFKLRVRIINEKDDSGSHNLQFKVNTEVNVIEYKCVNFDNPLGTGTVIPLEICTINGKKVFLHFWIFAMGGDNGMTRKLEYSVWMER